MDHGRFEIVSILEFIDESFEPILPAQAIACTLAVRGFLIFFNLVEDA